MGIKHLAYRIAHNSQAGAAGLADHMGMSKQVLINKLNPNSTSHHLNIQELEMLAAFAGDDANKQIAEHFAQKINAVVVPLPEVQLGDMGLLDGFMAAVVDLGSFTSEFQKDWADGEIDTGELLKLKKDAYAVHQRVATLMSMIEKLAG